MLRPLAAGALAMGLALAIPSAAARDGASASPAAGESTGDGGVNPGALTGHGGPIMAIAGRAGAEPIALTGSFDNSVGLWRPDGTRLAWLEGHTAAVKTVLATPNVLASAGDDATIITWNETGTPNKTLKGHRAPIADLALSGILLASAGWDGRIGLWDLSAVDSVVWLEGHQGPVTAVAYAPDGATLYSAGADGTLRAWDVATKSLKRIVLRHGFGINRIIVTDSFIAYGAVDGGTRAMNANGEPIADLTLDRRPILALALSPDERRLAVGDGEGHIMVVDTATWSIQHDFRAAARGPIWALAFTPDGASLIAGGIDNAAPFWPLDGGGEGPRLGLAKPSFHRAPETMDNGERQFQRKCSVCHVLTGDTARRAGPTLADLFGRRAGTIPGFNYSDTLTDSPIVWTAETLDMLFDAGPDHYVPGSNMPMQRITSTKDRRDLIEFLKTNTVE